MGLLLSALAIPAASFGGTFMHADPFEMAAAYLFRIVRDHPFVDGNKRTGAVAALVFLSLNGIEIDAEDDSIENMVIGAASGQADKGFVTEFFRRHLSR